MKHLRFLILFLFVGCLLGQPLFAAGPRFDHALWDAFLKKFVNDEGDVDYAAAQRDASLLNDYLKSLAAQNPLEISSEWPREEAMAFWMNAYNAGVIKIILDHYPVRSIDQIPSAWDMTVIHVGLEQYSLNQIRASKLIQNYRDEKIHLALSCGARSCPRLHREAFTGSNAEGRIFLAAREFLNNPGNVQIVPGKRKLYLSRLFKWYGRDFNLDFGTPEQIGKFTRDEMSILSFLIYYLEDLDKIEYLEGGKYKIAYFPFDSALNDWKGSASTNPGLPAGGISRPLETS